MFCSFSPRWFGVPRWRPARTRRSLSSPRRCCARPLGRNQLSRGPKCLCQSDLAHFDHLIWPTVSACILVLQFLIPVVFVSFLFGFVCLSGVALSRILISGTAVGFRLERSPARPGGPSVQGKRKPESNRAAAPRLASAFLFPLLQSPAKPVRVTPCFNDVSPIRHSV